MKNKNYKFSVGGVVCIIVAAIIYLVASVLTGVSVFNYLLGRDIYGDNLTSLILGKAFTYLSYLAVSTGLFGLGALLVFKQRNMTLLFFPVIGVLNYLVQAFLLLITYTIKMFNISNFTYLFKRFFDLLESFLEGGRFARLIEFYYYQIHGVFIAPIGSIAGMLLLVIAFALFALLVIRNRGERCRRDGKIVILSTIMVVLGYGTILANVIGTRSIFIAYLITRSISLPSILAQIGVFLISAEFVIPLVMMICTAVAVFMAGAWIVNPFKKEMRLRKQ